MGLEKHLNLFPPRIRKALFSFNDWDGISEIRLRRELPLSLTHFRGNLLLDENGKISPAQHALRANEEEIRSFVGAFCGGSVYRYFDTMKDGFLVDEEGFRLGLCPAGGSYNSILPERFEGANLRIPREVPGAAAALISYFNLQPLASTLILSAPGAGKTTLLRDLACSLSRGNGKHPPLRTTVIDERGEIFPSVFLKQSGICDVLSGHTKAEGMDIATRLFSPEVILCDEIGGTDEADALLSIGGAGCLFFATAHASHEDEAMRRPVLKRLIDAGIFSYIAVLERIPGERYQSRLRIRALP